MKMPRQLERIVKGFANHRRIQIMQLIEKDFHLNVLEVAERLNINFKTASEHLRRLTIAGLVDKRNIGSVVVHRLTNYSRLVLKFLRTLE